METLKTPPNDLSTRYSSGIILIHWLSVFLILTLFASGKLMENMTVEEIMKLYPAHASMGIFLLVLTIIRAVLYFKSPRPDHIKTGAKWNDNLAVGIQRAMYFAIILACLFGIATFVKGGYLDALKSHSPSEIIPGEGLKPPQLHSFFVSLLMVLMAMHVIGVLRHIFRTRENIIQRMWPN